jgi:hypothetical protein
MDLVENIKVLAARVEKQKDNIVSEEACKKRFRYAFPKRSGL